MLWDIIISISQFDINTRVIPPVCGQQAIALALDNKMTVNPRTFLVILALLYTY